MVYIRGATVKVIGLREKAVKRRPFQEKNQFNENRSKRKNGLTKTGLREEAVLTVTGADQ